MQQITQAQMRELKALLAHVGLDVKKRPSSQNAAWRPKWKGAGRGVFIYRGISAAEAKGLTLIHKGELCPGGLLWPQDIADHYKTHHNKGVMFKW